MNRSQNEAIISLVMAMVDAKSGITGCTSTGTMPKGIEAPPMGAPDSHPSMMAMVFEVSILFDFFPWEVLPELLGKCMRQYPAMRCTVYAVSDEGRLVIT